MKLGTEGISRGSLALFLVRSNTLRRIRRDPHQNINAHGFPGLDRRLEGPLAESQLGRGVHLIGKPLINLQVYYGTLFGDAALKDYILVKFFERQWSALEIKTSFRFGRHQASFYVYGARIRPGGRWCGSRNRSLAKLQRPAFAGRWQKNGVNLPAAQRTVNVQSSTTHRPRCDHQGDVARARNLRDREDHAGNSVWFGASETLIRTARPANADHSGHSGVSATSASFASTNACAFISASGTAIHSAIWSSVGLAARRAGSICARLGGKLAVPVSGG